MLKELENLIKEEADKLLCETHPHVCKLRDTAYGTFEQMAKDFIVSGSTQEPMSVQAALASMESDLAGKSHDEVE